MQYLNDQSPKNWEAVEIINKAWGEGFREYALGKKREAVTSSGAQPPIRKVYKWEEKPERCPVCDSPCFITSGGMNLTCYHCYLAEEFVKLWEAAQEFYASDSAWKESARTKARDHLGKVLKETEPSDKMLEISDAQGSSVSATPFTEAQLLVEAHAIISLIQNSQQHRLENFGGLKDEIASRLKNLGHGSQAGTGAEEKK